MTKKFSMTSFIRGVTGQAGMTMTEMGVTVALIGIGALGAASLSGNMATGSKKIQGMVAINTFATSLNTYLYSNLGCEALKSVGSFSTSPQEITLNTGTWNYQGINSFSAGYNADGSKKTPTKNFDIAELKAYLEPEPNAATVVDANNISDPLLKSMLKIKAVLKLGQKPVELVYNVPVLRTSAGQVTYCSDEKNLAETCATAQGKYNPTTKECDLGSACKIRDTYNRLTCNANAAYCSPIFGQSKPNMYTNDYSCPANSVANQTQTTTWVSQRSCGKKCTQSISNTMVWVMCLECPEGVAAPASAQPTGYTEYNENLDVGGGFVNDGGLPQF